MSVTVIAGLGNPGFKYRNTRHNIGFSIINAFAASLEAKWQSGTRFQAKIASVNRANSELLLIKPRTFINASGDSLSALLSFRKLPVSSLIVIYDDITLEFGRPKLSINGSAAGHNGVADLLNKIGSGFLRYRIGIGAKPNKKTNLADYVLSKFTADEQKTLVDKTSIYLEHLKLIIDKDTEQAMNSINQRTAQKHERTN